MIFFFFSFFYGFFCGRAAQRMWCSVARCVILQAYGAVSRRVHLQLLVSFELCCVAGLFQEHILQHRNQLKKQSSRHTKKTRMQHFVEILLMNDLCRSIEQIREFIYAIKFGLSKLMWLNADAVVMGANITRTQYNCLAVNYGNDHQILWLKKSSLPHALPDSLNTCSLLGDNPCVIVDNRRDERHTASNSVGASRDSSHSHHTDHHCRNRW